MRRYRDAYAALLADPIAFLVGQLLTFLIISLYVKFVEMRYAAEYVAWLGSGHLWANCRDYAVFCSQEVGVFAVLLVATLAWRAWRPHGWVVRSVAWFLGLVVLPVLSGVEVLGIAHFALFLTPLGPEEVRMLGWSGHIVSAANVLRSPDVAAGLALAVVGYLCAPPALWLPRMRRWRPALVASVVVAGALATLVPKPPITDALLVPHPLLWMLFGSRPQHIWPGDDGAMRAPSEVGRAPQQVPLKVVHAAFAPSNPLQSPPTSGARARDASKGLSVKGRPTNVLVLVLESTRAASVALYNAAAPAGRGLLRYRDEAVVFDHVYAPVPTSAHALFSILYGVYPYLGPFWTGADKAVVADSMALFFARAGYTTQLYVTSDLNYDNVRSFAARGFQTVLDPNDWPGQDAYAMLPWGRDDRLLIEQIKQFITTAGRRPFFLVAMTSNPHHPYAVDHLPPVPEVLDDNGRSAYERLVEYNLRLVTELYEWMKHRGVAERTLLLVLGDHGEAFGEHAGNFGHAAFIYDENVHIPCFILHPRRLGLPRRIEQLGSQVDLRATIQDIMGLRDTEPSDGMSLLRTDPNRQVINFTENGVSHFGVRDTRFSYIYTPHNGGEQVFDRRSDPQETHNMATVDPATTARYRARLQSWEAEHQLSLARVLQ
jgi:hypothetical protein